MISAEAHRLFRRLHDGTERFILTTHINPDGDALGSQLGLASFLRSRGKQVRIVNHDPTPEFLRFILSDEVPIEIYDSSTHDPALGQVDLVVLVDNSAPDRLGRMERSMLAASGRTLCIDHHPSRETPWGHHVLDEDACATAAMIYRLTRDCGWTPDPAAAEALYVGLATDTGFFRFNSTNAEAHEIAADLLRRGVDPARPYQAIYERNSLAFTRLMGHALADTRVAAGGAVASVTITRALLDRLQAHDVDTSEITTALLAMDGICVALLFRDLADGRVKVSLRSKGVLDVHRLAQEFGGGGHRNASGIVMPGQLEAVAQTVTQRAGDLLAGRR
jgi:phosphoesterase RecJ-like protein